MATELESERVSMMIESNSKKGVAGAGHVEQPDASGTVYNQLVERVRALEESLKKMERTEEGGKDAAGRAAVLASVRHGSIASCRRAIYSMTAEQIGKKGEHPCYTFQMPMHYPRYRKADYEIMPEWHLDRLLEEYGLPVNVASTLAEKREYAMGVFLWSNQRDEDHT